MKLSKLLSEYGDENIVFQTLDSDIKELNLRKNHTEIKFGTNEAFNLKGTVKMGLVVWLDRDKVQKIINEQKESFCVGCEFEKRDCNDCFECTVGSNFRPKDNQ